MESVLNDDMSSSSQRLTRMYPEAPTVIIKVRYGHVYSYDSRINSKKPLRFTMPSLRTTSCWGDEILYDLWYSFLINDARWWFLLTLFVIWSHGHIVAVLVKKVRSILRDHCENFYESYIGKIRNMIKFACQYIIACANSFSRFIAVWMYDKYKVLYHPCK